VKRYCVGCSALTAGLRRRAMKNRVTTRMGNMTRWYATSGASPPRTVKLRPTRNPTIAKLVVARAAVRVRPSSWRTNHKVLGKIVAHNLLILFSAIHELGIDPSFEHG
jgi:hypothetical protein